MNIYILTTNPTDSKFILAVDDLISMGHKLVSNPEDAEWIIVNVEGKNRKVKFIGSQADNAVGYINFDNFIYREFLK